MINFALQNGKIMENSTMNKVGKRVFPTIGDMLLMLLFFALSQGVAGLLLQAFGVTAPATSAIDAVDIETYMAEQEAFARYTALAHPILFGFSIFVLWLYARLRGGKRVISIRHSLSGLNPTIILVGVMWLLASQIILEPLLELMPSNEGSGIGRGVWAGFTAIISASVLEELLCRGVILEVLNKRWGIKTSILISALFFGLLHFDPANATVAIIAGLIFGVLYVRTSSIYATIIIHALNNAIAFALISFGAEDLSFREALGGGVAYYIVYALSVVIFVAASVEAWFRVLRKKSK